MCFILNDRYAVVCAFVSRLQPVTAQAIAKQVNIITHDTASDVAAREGVSVKSLAKDDPRVNAVVVQGSDLQTILSKSTEEKQEFWDDTLSKADVVFARTSPQQKLLIVEACQNRGHVVAVTGDGVNDAPALKKANIGVAMGIAGTEVAKDAADMILMDDNFASIVNGIEEGRVIFDNLRKSIAYTLTSNMPEIIPYLVFIVCSIPLPLSTVLILCVDLGTDMFPAIAFAHESKEADIMLRPPRNSKVDHLVDWNLIRWAYGQSGMIQTAGGFYAYFAVLLEFGLTLPMLYNLDRNQKFGKEDLFCHGDSCEYGENYCVEPRHPLTAGAEVCLLADDCVEALGQAQTAFFVAIVVAQLANVLVCKTRKLSLFTKGLNNSLMAFGQAHLQERQAARSGASLVALVSPRLTPSLVCGSPLSVVCVC
jgi:sodium/potassium-transporting ATPase subunit alpha